MAKRMTRSEALAEARRLWGPSVALRRYRNTRGWLHEIRTYPAWLWAVGVGSWEAAIEDGKRRTANT